MIPSQEIRLFFSVCIFDFDFLLAVERNAAL